MILASPRVVSPLPGVDFLSYECTNGAFTLAYIGPNHRLYFAMHRDGGSGLSTFEDIPEGWGICGWKPGNVESAAQALVSHFNLPWGGSK